MENTELSLFNSAVKFSSDDYLFVKPLCDFFGISYKNQAERIKKDTILRVEGRKKSHELLFGDKREHLALSKKGFVRWIQLINPNIVAPNLQKKFVKFQSLVFDYLFSSNLLKDNYIEYIKQQLYEFNRVKKLYSKVGNNLKNRRFHIDRVLSLSPAEWKELVETTEQDKELSKAV